MQPRPRDFVQRLEGGFAGQDGVTSEFLLLVLLIMGLGITASQSPSIDARFFWEWTTLACIAYMLSRGFAKSGSRSRSWDPREDLGDKRESRN